ncbi:MAG TPA: hypothetical protein VE615_11375 [Gaiellaceae bacterium]|nr:hypothetical protein [Gaiellaceae bacterium]
MLFAIIGGAHKLAEWARERGSVSPRASWAILWLVLAVFGFVATPFLLSAYRDATERQHQQPVTPYVPR